MLRLYFALVAASLTLPAGFGSLATHDSAAGDFVVLSHSDVNLRAGPGLDRVIVGRSDKGTLFPLVGETGEWYEIQMFSGVPRYVSRSLCYHLAPDQIIPGHRLELSSNHDSVAALTAAIAVETDRAAQEAAEMLPDSLDAERHETLRQLLEDRYLLDLVNEQGVQPAVYWLPEAEALRP